MLEIRDKFNSNKITTIEAANTIIEKTLEFVKNKMFRGNLMRESIYIKKNKKYIIIGLILISLSINLYIVFESYNNEKNIEEKNKSFCETLDISIVEKVQNATDEEVFVEYQNASMKFYEASALLFKTSYVSDNNANGVNDSLGFTTTLKVAADYLGKKSDNNEKIPENILKNLDEILKNIVRNIDNESLRTKYVEELNSLLNRVNDK